MEVKTQYRSACANFIQIFSDLLGDGKDLFIDNVDYYLSKCIA